MINDCKLFIHIILGIPFRSRANVLCKLPKYSVGAELGVFKGEFTRFILAIVKPSKLYLIDGWWELYGEYFPNWGKYTNFGRLSTKEAYNSVKKIVDKYDKKHVCDFKIGNDLSLLKNFPDAHFDWVYLDTSHDYEHTRRELLILNDKIKKEGVICGDDWNEDPNHIHYGIKKAVKEFCKDYQWKIDLIDKYDQWIISRVF